MRKKPTPQNCITSKYTVYNAGVKINMYCVSSETHIKIRFSDGILLAAYLHLHTVACVGAIKGPLFLHLWRSLGYSPPPTHSGDICWSLFFSNDMFLPPGHAGLCSCVMKATGKRTGQQKLREIKRNHPYCMTLKERTKTGIKVQEGKFKILHMPFM